jgi:hypothetical protein
MMCGGNDTCGRRIGDVSAGGKTIGHAPILPGEADVQALQA